LRLVLIIALQRISDDVKSLEGNENVKSTEIAGYYPAISNHFQNMQNNGRPIQKITEKLFGIRKT